MRTFKTHDGREWKADLNLAVAYEVQQEHEAFTYILGRLKPEWADAQFKLIEHDDESAKQFMEMVVATPILLKLSWLCVRDQAPDGYTELDYTKGFKGDTVLNVKEVMLGELADFIPQMGTLFLKYLELHKQSSELASRKLQDAVPSLDTKMKELLGIQEEVMNDAIKSLDQIDMAEHLQ